MTPGEVIEDQVVARKERESGEVKKLVLYAEEYREVRRKVYHENLWVVERNSQYFLSRKLHLSEKDFQAVKGEIDIMMSIDHENIVNWIDVYYAPG